MNELQGSLLAWSVATVSILISAGWAYKQEKGIRPSGLPILDFVSALVLTYIALDIFRPVPILSQPICLLISSPLEPLKTVLEETKISYVVLLFALVAGLSFLRVRKKERAAKKRLKAPLSVAWKNFALMTLLPIVVQYWVLVASTERLMTYGGILAIGLFILAGPASWQFVIRIMMLDEKRKKKRVLGILGIMGISLAGVLIATFFGVQLKNFPATVDPTVLKHVAGFTMIAVPYFFFYSYWGEKWSENRPIAVIIAMVGLALYSSITISGLIQQFVATMIFWALFLIIPFILYSDESYVKDYTCPECVKKGKSVKMRVFKEDRVCMEHSDLTCDEVKVEERKSILRRIRALLFERFQYRPWGDEMIITLDPDVEKYGVEQEIAISITVRNSDNRLLRLGIKHPVHCKIDAHWLVNKHKHAIAFPESKWIEPGKEVCFSYDVKVPSPPPALVPRENKLVIESSATFFEVWPDGCFIQPIVSPFPRRITVKKKVETSKALE